MGSDNCDAIVDLSKKSEEMKPGLGKAEQVFNEHEMEVAHEEEVMSEIVEASQDKVSNKSKANEGQKKARDHNYSGPEQKRGSRKRKVDFKKDFGYGVFLDEKYPMAAPSVRNRRDRERGLGPQFRLNPSAKFESVIRYVDKILFWDRQLKHKQDLIDQAINDLYRINHQRGPPLEKGSIIKEELFYQVVRAYLHIKEDIEQLERPRENPNFNQMMAALEIVASIIMFPDVLGYCQEDRSGSGFTYLWTAHFVTPWASDIIDRISWACDGNGVVFYPAQRSQVIYYKPEEYEEDEEDEESDSDEA